MFNGMDLKIDKAGRLILPKPVREPQGFTAGNDVEAQETPEGIVLKPAHPRASMIKKDGLWVHTGKVPPEFDVVQSIRDDRDDRIRKLAGCESLPRLKTIS